MLKKYVTRPGITAASFLQELVSLKFYLSAALFVLPSLLGLSLLCRRARHPEATIRR